MTRWRFVSGWVGLLAVAVSARGDEPGRALPATGREVPELAGVEAALQGFLDARSVGAATLVVARDGRLYLERGYGFLDAAGRRPVAPDTPMRLASLTKPITAAAVRKLAAAGKFDLDAKVVDLLEVKPPAGQDMDGRWREITVRHLLEHRGGWDREAAYDPMFRSIQIAQALRISRPVRPNDVLRYMAGQPLQFDPGTQVKYSNFGYSVLGRVIEKASGKAYIDYVREDLLAPLGVTSVALGRSRPSERDPREPVYRTKERFSSVYGGSSGRRPVVTASDGGFNLEAMDSHGGLVSSAIDYARFLDAYHVDGTPCEPPVRGYDETFFGSLPGTWTMGTRRPDGTVIVAFCNQRDDPSGLPYEPIKEVLVKAVGAVESWPEGEPLHRAR